MLLLCLFEEQAPEELAAPIKRRALHSASADVLYSAIVRSSGFGV